jgi:SAM-dependent methyltransferase
MTSSTLTTLKDQHRTTWATGDYAAVAEHIDDVPPAHLLTNAGVGSGDEVLDVATGTGNVALQAAARGARVTGLDLVPALLDVARERADAAGAAIAWVEGDAEALPFADASFDRVLSVFGIQFAPRHQVVADELVRVCRPGGTVGLVNWSRTGLIGRMFGVFSKYLPPAPDFASPPPLWGDDAHVRSLFAGHDLDLTIGFGANPFVFRDVEEYMTFFEDNYGPTIMTRRRLEDEGTWDACRAELRELYEGLNVAGDGSLRIDAEYVVITGTRRS